MKPLLFVLNDLFQSKLTGADSPPLIDPLYWHGRAPLIGYWALGITIVLSWMMALCWVVFIVRKSRRESLGEHNQP